MRGLLLVVALVVGGSLAGCSDDDDGSSNSGGSGGSAGSSAGSGGSGGSSAGSGGSAGSPAGSGGSAGSSAGAGGSQAGAAGSAGSAGGQGGAGGSGALCPDPSNPMFGSCTDTFLVGCYSPDLTGACTTTDGDTIWSDGSKYLLKGDKPGLYGPGDTEPCIRLEPGKDSFVAYKGTDKLTYAADTATQTATITCPDGSSFTASFDQVTAFNRCRGVNCPSP